MSLHASIADRPPAAPRGSWRALVVAGAIGLLVAGAYLWSGRRGSGEPTTGPSAPTDYDRAVAQLDRDIDMALRFAGAQPDSWMRRGNAVALLLSRARLTRDAADLDRADAELATAFRHAAPGSGPLLLRASLHSTRHRFDEALADLAVVARRRRPPAQEAEALALRADIALARRHTDEALAGYEAALVVHREPSILARTALARYRAGDAAGADRDFDAALSLLRPIDRRERAWTLVTRAETETARERFADARRSLDDAERAFSGWWLVAEHRESLRRAERGAALR